ncbi:MAG: hypothetical protein RIR18_1523 [Pseudomonadota bacterium]|jgi:diguanylate cyclase (GGDEF)-like protein/PAS domain S-box-containing protein
MTQHTELTEANHCEIERLRLLARVFECTSEAVVITDAGNRILEVNPAFTRMTGYALAEVVGQDPRIMSSGDTPRSTIESLWRGLKEKGAWEGEVWDRRKDGSVYVKLLRISVAYGQDGQVENYIANFHDISERKKAEDRLHHMAHHDPLTGLSNRASLEAQMKRALAGAKRDGSTVGVMLIDMDNFKQVNDTLGHNVGDELLIQIAHRLVESVRGSDLVSRIGGDEFVVILHHIDNVMSIGGIASKILRNLGASYSVGKHMLYSTPSIGVALFPADGVDAETLIRNADSAMYHAKSQGRNNFQFFTACMNEAAQERLKLEVALRQAMEGLSLYSAPQFHLCFQPQLDTATGRIVGLEALARWVHPEMGNIPPVIFIKIAEETGLIQPLGDWVFWEACRKLREFKDAGMSDVRVAVNLSTQQLRHEYLPVVIRGALACYDLAAGDLELEITESTAMQNPQATIEILQQLHDLGIVLAIDDFGTGYSSLAYLKQLPINRLKLDQSFVRDVSFDKDDSAICSATIVLGHNLGLELVAEGVETEAQRDHLKGLGCDLFQGFLYCKPLPAETICDFVLNWNRNPSPL